MLCGVAVSFHLPYWVSAVSVVLSGGIGSFPFRGCRDWCGEVRMGQATNQVCLSEASLVSTLLVEESLITKVGLYSIRKRLSGNCEVHNISRQSHPCVRGDPFPHITSPQRGRGCWPFHPVRKENKTTELSVDGISTISPTFR